MTRQRKSQDSGRKRIPPPGLVALLLLVAFVAFECSLSAVVAAILLTLSIVLDYFVVRAQQSDSRLGNELAVCEYFKALLIGVYLILTRAVPPDWRAAPAFAASALAFFLGVGVTLAMIWTAAAMIRPRPPGESKPQFMQSSLNELLTNKILALTGVMIAFLHVTYFFAFALAFSDRFVSRGLWAEKRVEEKKPDTRDDRPPQKAVNADRVHKFFFIQSATTLACTAEVSALTDQDGQLRKRLRDGGLASRIDALKSLTLPACDRLHDPLQRRAAAWNIHELYELRDVLHGMADGVSYLVEMRGHANDARLKTDAGFAYSSNYEISKQRADQAALALSNVFREVRQGLNEPAVRWLAYGVANEDSLIDPGSGDWIDAAPLEQKLSVEVRVLEVADSFQERYLRAAQGELTAARISPRDLELIDYLYFTTYTITTAGYGDIIPVGNYAKLIVTLANLIEMIFVVVLVNVVANTRPQGEP